LPAERPLVEHLEEPVPWLLRKLEPIPEVRATLRISCRGGAAPDRCTATVGESTPMATEAGKASVGAALRHLGTFPSAAARGSKDWEYRANPECLATQEEAESVGQAVALRRPIG